MNLEKYRVLFADETTDHLAEMVRALVSLERAEPAGSAEDAIDTIFRMAHSIKGMAASLDYQATTALAHSLEDWLEPWRRAGTIPEEGIALLYEVVSALERMVIEVGESAGSPQARDDLRERLSQSLASAPSSEPSGEGRSPGKKVVPTWRLHPCRGLFACGRRRSTASSPLSAS